MSQIIACLAIISMIVSIVSGIPTAIRGWRDLIWRKKREDAINDDRTVSADCEEEVVQTEKDSALPNGRRDLSKYSLDGTGEYGKGRLVLEVIRRYTVQHRDITYNELLQRFPKSLRGVANEKTFWGCVNLREDAVRLYVETGRKRHFLENDEIIKLFDGTEVAVSSQWGSGNIGLFIDAARKLGFVIEPIAL